MSVSQLVAATSLVVCLVSSSPVSAQTPDVIVYDVGVNGPDTNDIQYWGVNTPGTIAAYNFGTQSCNQGTLALDWFDAGGDTRHPVISQNMFRLKEGRFEQLGQSWLKHGFCAVNEFESECGPCQSSDCDTLGVGCADTYWATLNDGRGGRSKRRVDATQGTHLEGGGQPTGGTVVRGRLQVFVDEVDPALNPGAEYFIEGHYVTADDAAAGMAHNNASWRRIVFHSVSDPVGGGPTHREEPAIYAWRDADPDVEIRVLPNTEGAFTSYYFLAYKVELKGPAEWHYEYALHNLNSTQSAGSFSLEKDPSATISQIGFRDVRYHSGDTYDGTDWATTDSGTSLTWATEEFAVNPDANALRWATLYNYRFVSNTPPEDGQLTIGLFQPGTNSSIVVDDVPVPSAFVPLARPELAPGAPASGPTVAAPLVSSRNGAGHNPMGFRQEAPAVVGATWRGSVALEDGARSVVVVGLGGATEGVLGAAGEVLVRAPFRVLGASELHAGRGWHDFRLPDEPALVGTTVHLQGAILAADGWRLTNALELTVGAGR